MTSGTQTTRHNCGFVGLKVRNCLVVLQSLPLNSGGHVGEMGTKQTQVYPTQCFHLPLILVGFPGQNHPKGTNKKTFLRGMRADTIVGFPGKDHPESHPRQTFLRQADFSQNLRIAGKPPRKPMAYRSLCNFEQARVRSQHLWGSFCLTSTHQQSFTFCR